MSETVIGILSIAALLGLLVFRVPIGIAMISVSIVGISALLDFSISWSLLKTVPYTFVATWELSSVPMFLFMGYLCYHSGITTGLFKVARVFLARLPGGLAIASIFGCAGFAAVSGSSIACAAAMGRIAIPEMLKQRYDVALATGTLAAAGTIGALIPPSILMIIYGTIAQVSVIKLFLGGLMLGLLTAVAYIVVILVRVWRNPELAPRYIPTEDETTTNVLVETWPIILLVMGVFGGLFAGIFTPTEAGAVGSTLALIIAMAKRGLTGEALWNSLLETVVTTSSVIIIAVGAGLFTRLMALAGISDALETAVMAAGVSPMAVMLGIALTYLILGMFLDPLGALLITLPIFIPLVDNLGYDLVWFGVIVVKFLEVGMITPPLGLNVFVIKNVVGNVASMATIFRGIIWFFVADLVLILINIIWPSIIMFFPSIGG